MRFHYTIYGLNLSSDSPIPGLVTRPSPGTVEVQLFLRRTPCWFNERTAQTEQSWFVSAHRDDERGRPVLRITRTTNPACFRFAYSDGTEFIIDPAGRKIWATWLAPSTLSDTATYLLNPVLGFLLAHRGSICLHASAVAIGGQAVAFIGPAGSGKSTTAALFAARGYPIICDDVLVLSSRKDIILAQPGYPRLRLWPHSVQALFGGADALPRLTPTWDKRYLDLTRDRLQFQNHALPLGAIYIIGDRAETGISPSCDGVTRREALVALVKNSYVGKLLDKTRRALELRFFGHVATSTPMRRLTPDKDIGGLWKLYDTLLADVSTLNLSAQQPEIVKDRAHV